MVCMGYKVHVGVLRWFVDKSRSNGLGGDVTGVAWVRV